MDKKALGGGLVRSGSLTGKKERNVSLDIIRIIAFSMVVYTHFFMYSGYYKMELVGPQAFIMTVIRCIGISCVPMFVFLTGYLLKDRQISGKYYGGIKNTLITYFFASGVCYLFNCSQADPQEPATLQGFLKGLLGFTSATYSWYIDMYIGLFLLIPFLNIIWKNLTEKKHRIILILTLVFLTIAPQLVNTFVFGVEGWWQQPSSSEEYFLIIPEWWQKIFPLTYYFTGCYIREYGIKINKWLNLILIPVAAFAFGGYAYYRSTPGKFLTGNWQNNASPFVYILAILIFVFFVNLDIRPKSTVIRKGFNLIAELTLGAYLVSCVFDVYFYEKLRESLGSTTIEFRYLWIMAPCIILVSLFVAFLINLATKLVIKTVEGIKWLISKLVSLVKKDNKTEKPAPKAPSGEPVRKKAPARQPVSARNQNPARPPMQERPHVQGRPPVPERVPEAEAQAAPVTPSQVRMPYPVINEEPVAPLYKKRVNTYEDDAEEVLVVIEE